jgi:hypothetical protein
MSILSSFREKMLPTHRKPTLPGKFLMCHLWLESRHSLEKKSLFVKNTSDFLCACSSMVEP